MSLEPGTRIGRFVITDRIGAGGMGEVYRARDSRLGRDVAIKTLGASLVHDSETVARFEREAMAASALNHPSIVTIYDIGQDEVGGRNLNYIAMEFIEGETLTARIAEPDETGTILEILTDVAEVLARAHAAGIVHRDLKPDNIMITRDGLAKILDFGLAKLVEGDLSPLTSEDATVAKSPISRDGVVVGTVAYMSPEQASGKTVDHRSDLFAFGSILHEAFTRRRAWRGATAVDTLYQIMHGELPVASEIPADVQKIIRRCVAKSPADRYQSAKSWLQTCEQFESDRRAIHHRLRGHPLGGRSAVESFLSASRSWLRRWCWSPQPRSGTPANRCQIVLSRSAPSPSCRSPLPPMSTRRPWPTASSTASSTACLSSPRLR